MSILPPTIQDLIEEFGKLPGIGPKSAQRVVFYLIKSKKEDIQSLNDSLAKLLEGVKFCSVCHNITESDPCPICANTERLKNEICVVEKPLDMVAIEETREFKGLYHVLHGSISPINGIGPEDLKIKELISRVKGNEKTEVIMATNPNIEGEATAMYISKLMSDLDVQVTRIARGLPTGADLDYADQETLTNALKGRKEF